MPLAFVALWWGVVRWLDARQDLFQDLIRQAVAPCPTVRPERRRVAAKSKGGWPRQIPTPDRRSAPAAPQSPPVPQFPCAGCAGPASAPGIRRAQLLAVAPATSRLPARPRGRRAHRLSTASVANASSPSGSRIRRSPPAGNAASAAASASGAATSGTRARPLCSQAEATTLRQCARRFSARSASSFTSLRCDHSGRDRGDAELGRLLQDQVHLLAARDALQQRDAQRRFVVDRAARRRSTRALRACRAPRCARRSRGRRR